MLWVLKRTVSMRRFFWAPKAYVKNNGQEIIHNFRLYLNLWSLQIVKIKLKIVYWWNAKTGNHSSGPVIGEISH